MRLQVVQIDEEKCIGCTKCLKVCPTDAIIGAAKQLHGVLTDYCIGCMLCLPPCPVDCIEVKDIAARSAEKVEKNKQRIKAKKARLPKIVDQIVPTPVSVDFAAMMQRIKAPIMPSPALLRLKGVVGQPLSQTGEGIPLIEKEAVEKELENCHSLLPSGEKVSGETKCSRTDEGKA